MEKVWIKPVFLEGSISEAIEVLQELQNLYPGLHYELKTYYDNELWLINVNLKRELEQEQRKLKLEAEKKHELALLEKITAKYAKESK